MLVRRFASLRRVKTSAANMLAVMFALVLASCGDDEPLVVINWPEMSGAFQYRALMPLDASGLTCVEHGDINITHGGQATWSASGDIRLDCWLDNERIHAVTETLEFSSGTFGSETNKASWPMSWQGRTGWTYSGDVYWINATHMKANGSGTGIIDIPGGGTMTRDFTWVICRQFTDQSDKVEQGCTYTG